MRNCLLCGALLLGLTAVVAAEPPIAVLQPMPGAQPPAPEPTPVVKLAVTPGSAEDRALKYTLLPDPLDLTPGNAVPIWIRAGAAADAAMRKLNEGPNKVVAPVGTPLSLENKRVLLKDLPKEEIRAYLAHFATALRLADQAARCDHCDWEFPPLKMQDLDWPIEEVQHLRTIAALLQTRCMLDLSESHFDDALLTLQTGFALARDVGKGDTLIQDLVGIAVAAIMFNQVEQWQQVPGSPNLFWALTDLPTPLVNPAHAMRAELTMLYRSFPPLREVLRGSDKGAMLSEADTSRIIAELFKDWGAYIGQDVPDWQKKLGAAALILKTYPDAKKYLKEHGRTDEQLEAMPAAQAVLLYFVEQYDNVKDDFLKWLNVPPWEARAGMQDAVRRVRAIGPNGNPIIALQLPAVEKVYEARVRIEHIADYMRCAEALRLYAATHEGKPPEKLDDVKLPLPLDAYTGEGFGKLYKVQADGTAVFEVPAPPNLPSLARRFELAAPAK